MFFESSTVFHRPLGWTAAAVLPIAQVIKENFQKTCYNNTQIRYELFFLSFLYFVINTNFWNVFHENMVDQGSYQTWLMSAAAKQFSERKHLGTLKWAYLPKFSVICPIFLVNN